MNFGKLIQLASPDRSGEQYDKAKRNALVSKYTRDVQDHQNNAKHHMQKVTSNLPEHVRAKHAEIAGLHEKLARLTSGLSDLYYY